MKKFNDPIENMLSTAADILGGLQDGFREGRRESNPTTPEAESRFFVWFSRISIALLLGAFILWAVGG